MEAVFAKGDRCCGQVLYEAWRLGCRFDGWTEHFRYDLWRQAFRNCRLVPEMIANRALSYETPLPWDHLSTGG